jgi:hypothetical protein
MTPGPELSLAEPLHVPARLSADAAGAGVGEEGAGVDDDPPPPPPPPQPTMVVSRHVPIDIRKTRKNAGRPKS